MFPTVDVTVRDQRPSRCWSTARAAGPAVEARSTCGPSRTGTAPAATQASSSAGPIPPSGPTTTAISTAAESRSAGTADTPCSASSCSTRTSRPPSSSQASPATAVPETWSRTAGTRARRACLAAARAVSAHFRRALAALGPFQRTIERSASQGTTASTPSSTAAWTAMRSRSPLARAWTSTSAGVGAGSSATASSRTDTASGAAASTVPWPSVPDPSARSTASPGARRMAAAACRASAPSKTTSAPALAPARAPGSRWNRGAVTGSSGSPAAGRTCPWPGVRRARPPRRAPRPGAPGAGAARRPGRWAW
ncbi:hypothetical protein BW40_02056 [Micrococcus luteus]|nr:hypothetical protein BW40_02056 [Micrococcus luteus]